MRPAIAVDSALLPLLHLDPIYEVTDTNPLATLRFKRNGVIEISTLYTAPLRLTTPTVDEVVAALHYVLPPVECYHANGYIITGTGAIRDNEIVKVGKLERKFMDMARYTVSPHSACVALYEYDSTAERRRLASVLFNLRKRFGTDCILTAQVSDARRLYTDAVLQPNKTCRYNGIAYYVTEYDYEVYAAINELHTPEAIAERTGRSRSSVLNTVRKLKLAYGENVITSSTERYVYTWGSIII